MTPSGGFAVRRGGARSRRRGAAGPVVALSILALALSGCQALVRPIPPPPPARVTPFSIGAPGGPFPGGWHVEAVRKFRIPSQYRLVADAGTTVVEGTADASASGLVEFVDIDLHERPILAWRWKAIRPVPGANTTRRNGDDAPLRILLSFEGDVKTLPVSERVFFGQVRLISGIPIPYATLEYVWGAGASVETVVINSYTTRIRTVVLRNEADPLGQWVSEQRDVLEDFRSAFDEEPGRITAVAVYTDADATGASSQGYYGDLTFLTRAEGAAGATAQSVRPPAGVAADPISDR